MWLLDRRTAASLSLAMIVCFVCSVAVAQVKAEMFDTVAKVDCSLCSTSAAAFSTLGEATPLPDVTYFVSQVTENRQQAEREFGSLPPQPQQHANPPQPLKQPVQVPQQVPQQVPTKQAYQAPPGAMACTPASCNYGYANYGYGYGNGGGERMGFFARRRAARASRGGMFGGFFRGGFRGGC